MAFTGVAVVKQVADQLVRITGISLAAGATGTIGVFGAVADVVLPKAFHAEPYDYDGPLLVTTQDSIQVTVTEDAASTPPAAGVPNQAMFYGLTAGTGNGGATDYAATVAVNAAVPFPRAGPTTAGGIVAGGTNQFVLPVAGTYEVSWVVGFLEASQLLLKLGATEQPTTTTTSGAGTQQNTNTVLVTATAGQLLSLCNASGNAAALTVQTADGSLTHAQAPNINIRLVAAASGGGGAAADVSIVKNAPPALFVASIVNNDPDVATAALEIYARFH